MSMAPAGATLIDSGSIPQAQSTPVSGTDDGTYGRRRRYGTRTRTGCGTCRIRRVKCDEGRPHCSRCTETGRHCEGYAPPTLGSKKNKGSKAGESSGSDPSPSQAKANGSTKTTKLLITRATHQKFNLYHQGGFFGLCCLPGQTPVTLFDAITRLETHSAFLEATQTLFNEPMYSPLGHCYNSVVRTNDNLLLKMLSVYSDATILAARGDILNPDPKTVHACLHGVSHALSGPVPKTILYPMMAMVSTMCLVEILTGGARLAIHFNGLMRMVDYAGGLDRIDYGHLPRTIEATDLLRAIYQGSLPIYTSIGFPKLEHRETEHSRPYLVTSPLSKCEDFQLAQKYNHNISDSSIRLVQDAFIIFKIRVTAVDNDADSSVTSDVNRSLYDMYYAQLQTASGPVVVPTKSTQHFVNEAIRQAAIIWWRAVARNTPFGAPENEVNLTAIYDCMSWVSLEAWTGLPFIFLWIVMIACSASTRIPRVRRFFFAEMSRSSLCFGTSCISLFTTNTNNFLWLSDQIREHTTPLSLASS